MPIRLSNIRLGLEESELALPERLARVLAVGPGDIQRWRILRKSLDARDKSDLAFVYSAEVAVAADETGLLEQVNGHRKAGRRRCDGIVQKPFHQDNAAVYRLSQDAKPEAPNALTAEHFATMP